MHRIMHSVSDLGLNLICSSLTESCLKSMRPGLPWNNYSIIHAFSIIRFQLSGTTCLPLGCHVQQLSMGVFELNKIERSYIDHCRKGTTGCTNMMSNKSHSINFSGKIYGNRPDSTYLKSRSKFILKSILLSLFLYSRK